MDSATGFALGAMIRRGFYGADATTVAVRYPKNLYAGSNPATKPKQPATLS